MERVQQSLRDVFGRWGLPQALRLDNGYPWGNWSELATVLALWLGGLGVEVKFNPPRQARANGVVERSHGVSQDWGDVGTHGSVEELQRCLDDLDQIQRQEYRLANGRSRWELFPQLRQVSRSYSRAWEEEHWQEGRARAYLAEQVAARQVDSQGRVKVYARSYYVGVVHKHRRALVQYDPAEGVWVFSDEDGVQWCRHPAEQITAERIRGLNISARPSRNHGKTSCPN